MESFKTILLVMLAYLPHSLLVNWTVISIIMKLLQRYVVKWGFLFCVHFALRKFSNNYHYDVKSYIWLSNSRDLTLPQEFS